MTELKLLGIKVTPGTMAELHVRISELIAGTVPSFILSGNIHGLNLAGQHPWLADLYNRAAVVRVDGAGIVLGARIRGACIPPRITWADWGWPLAIYLSQKGHSVFLLGGPPGAADNTGKRMCAIAPSLKVVGTHHGYFEKQGAENALIIHEINVAAPDVLIIGLGMPLQEQWLLENANKLDVKVFITAGAAFEYLSGTLRRCPDWVGRSGFEWLYRLLQNPGRMAKRYIYGNMLFITKILLERIRKGRL